MAGYSDHCLTFGGTAAIQYGQLVAARTQNGRPITVEDAQIAANALSGGLRLAKCNEKDFANIPGLVMVNSWMVGWKQSNLPVCNERRIIPMNQESPLQAILLLVLRQKKHLSF